MCYSVFVHKGRIYLTLLRRLAPGILALEIAFLAGCWLLNRYWSLMQRFTYADTLLIMGALAAIMGSAGMMRSPYGIPLSSGGIWASHFRVTEDEKHEQLVDEMIHQTSFGMRFLAVGVITILVSIALTYTK